MSKPSPSQISEYFAEMGRKGGATKTKKKTAAARKNIVRAQKAIRKLFPKTKD